MGIEEEAIIVGALNNYEPDVHEVEVKLDLLRSSVIYVGRQRSFWSFMYETDENQREGRLRNKGKVCIISPRNRG